MSESKKPKKSQRPPRKWEPGCPEEQDYKKWKEYKERSGSKQAECPPA